LKFSQPPDSLGLVSNYSPQQHHRGFNFRQRALVRAEHSETALHQFSEQRRLNVGIRDNQIRLEFRNFIELRRAETSNSRLRLRPFGNCEKRSDTNDRIPRSYPPKPIGGFG
jgi:hypothetical protein